ncbi:VWA domain-containing protein [Tamlana sp. I1]|uniref:VWA domain-containing protein n=1 Tax=Tamlana sp. I1 TaxID=2762061 RepID=UPI00188E02E0|nr:VWA domain-containing protein [Tamlana sp. I1]
MSSETLIYIILAGTIALLLALFQYFYKAKSMSTRNMLFAFLRFITIFSVLLLIVNPSFEQTTLTVEKPNLIVAIDNSSSVKNLKQDINALKFLNEIKTNSALKEKFNVDYYTFGEKLQPLEDSLAFLEKQTNIFAAFKQLARIYKTSNSPTILISDGNQTFGNDYHFASNLYNHPIYPVILGDTVTYTDLKIQQLNVNRYAYLKNEFPIETILVYNGTSEVSSKFEVFNGNRTVYSKVLKFSKNNNSKVVHFTLPANQVGVSKYKAVITPLDNEQNKVNNIKNFAVEVINQKTKIAIVSDFPHPDIGALKKSIESNEQRFVTLIDSRNIINQINDFQLIILYQPNNKFKILFEKLQDLNKNYFTIIGSKTDLHFMNRISEDYQQSITNQKEDYQAELNINYTPFIIDDINFESYPPLHSNYGVVKFKHPVDVIINKTVRGVSVNEPLLATFENNGRREAILFGENIWQWRAYNYVEKKSFHDFDDFIGKLVQYLASNKQKSRLNVDFQSFYDGNSNVIIKAEYFDKNYVFDARETLQITVSDKNSNFEKTFPLVLKNNHYQVDLSGLQPSEYQFSIKAKNENISKSGSFQILEYDVEQQFLNANVAKLEQLADNSSGTPYFIEDTSEIINELLGDKRYVSVQKSSKNNTPLIDWKWLLGLIALSLGAEWFARKYNGLI